MSEGVVITLVLNLKPEFIDAFCDGIEEAAKATRTFAGFRDIIGRRNDADPNQVILIEHWDSVHHYKTYIAWRAETGFMDELDKKLSKPLQLEFWTDRFL